MSILDDFRKGLILQNMPAQTKIEEQFRKDDRLFAQAFIHNCSKDGAASIMQATLNVFDFIDRVVIEDTQLNEDIREMLMIILWRASNICSVNPFPFSEDIPIPEFDTRELITRDEKQLREAAGRYIWTVKNYYNRLEEIKNNAKSG